MTTKSINSKICCTFYMLTNNELSETNLQLESWDHLKMCLNAVHLFNNKNETGAVSFISQVIIKNGLTFTLASMHVFGATSFIL